MDIAILVGLFVIATLYSSVGHGGASGYLAILSLTIYASEDPLWLKQHAWSLNLVVAGIAFFMYEKNEYFNYKIAFPLIIASLPAAFFGGYLKVDNQIYDTLLSLTLMFAAWKLYSVKTPIDYGLITHIPEKKWLFLMGVIIGFLSGVIGVGGGIFLSPLLLLFKWSDVKTTAGISALFIWVNSASGLVGSSLSGEFVLDFDIFLPFTLAVVTGGFIGSKLGAERFNQNVVKYLLVIVLIIASVRQITGLLGL